MAAGLVGRDLKRKKHRENKIGMKELFMDDVLISIIIPVYNVEKYLRQCLDSVLSQSYSNIEVICIDDASTDGSLSILKEYSDKDKRIRLLKNQKNEGNSFTRNAGLKEINGKYTYFLDADDYIELNAIEELTRYAEQYETECIYFNSRLLSEGAEVGKGPALEYGLREINKKIYTGPVLFKLLIDKNVYTNSLWRRFWKTEFLLENNLKFDDELRTSEDAYFSIKAILCGKRMMIVDEIFHIYRRREGSLTTAARPDEMIYVFKSYCMLLEFWKEHRFLPDIEESLNNSLKNMYITAKKIYLRNKGKISKEDFKTGTERHLFEVLIEQEYEKSLSIIEPDILQKIRSFPYVIVYGAYIYAGEVVEKLVRNGIDIHSIAITKMHEKAEGINGIPIHEIRDLISIKDEAIVVMGVGKNNRQDVIKTLVKYKFNNFISLD